jgi:hypothetical protein
MVLIWDLELDRQVLTELKSLNNSDNKEIKKQAETVLQLSEIYSGLR